MTIQILTMKEPICMSDFARLLFSSFCFYSSFLRWCCREIALKCYLLIQNIRKAEVLQQLPIQSPVQITTKAFLKASQMIWIRLLKI